MCRTCNVHTYSDQGGGGHRGTSCAMYNCIKFNEGYIKKLAVHVQLYSVQGRVHEGTSRTCTSTYLRQLWGSLSWKQYNRVSSIFIKVRFVFQFKETVFVTSSLSDSQLYTLLDYKAFCAPIFYFNSTHFLFVRIYQIILQIFNI